MKTMLRTIINAYFSLLFFVFARNMVRGIAPAIFSSASGVWRATGAAGHTGIVLHVKGNTATVLNTSTWIRDRGSWDGFTYTDRDEKIVLNVRINIPFMDLVAYDDPNLAAARHKEDIQEWLISHGLNPNNY
jgi:hypothetical protein